MVAFNRFNLIYTSISGSLVNTFSKRPDIQRKALQNALRSPDIGKHGKRRTTLLKEEIYKRMMEKILYNVNSLIEAQIQLALNGKDGIPDTRAIDSLLNRAFGKPSQEVISKITVDVPIDPIAKAMADKAIAEYLNRKPKN